MHKEYLSYGKEAKKQTAKIAKMREDGKDAHDIRKQVRCRVGSDVVRGPGHRVGSPLRCPTTATATATRARVSQLEVLAETEAMIPDTRVRLDRAREDLEEFVVRTEAAAHDCRHAPHALSQSTHTPPPRSVLRT